MKFCLECQLIKLGIKHINYSVMYISQDECLNMVQMIHMACSTFMMKKIPSPLVSL